MTYDDVEKNIKKMADFYNKKIGSEQIAIWYEKIRYFYTKDALVAIDNITSSERYFPTPAIFIKYYYKSKSCRAANENITDKKNAENFFKPGKHNTQLAKDCVVLINRWYDNLGDKYEDMKALDELYPNIGFRQETENLKKDLEKMEKC